jgi:hypothetical protein
MNKTLLSACAEHGVALNVSHVAAVEALGDGTILKELLVLVVAYGPKIAEVVPQVLADLASGNYFGAFMLLIKAISAVAPAAAPQ